MSSPPSAVAPDRPPMRAGTGYRPGDVTGWSWGVAGRRVVESPGRPIERERHGRRGGRLGPQRARRRRHPRARGPAGDRPGVAADRRRRRAHPRPGPRRRRHARHLLRGAPDGVGVPVLPGVRPAGRGVELLVPDVSYAQPLPGGRAGVAYRDLERTVEELGVDGRRLAVAGRRRPGRRVSGWRWATSGRCPLVDPPRRAAVRARHPGAGHARVGPPVRRRRRARAAHRRRRARDLAAPVVAAAGTALLLGTLAHAEGGWPIPRGGSGAITAALVADLEAHGGTIRTDHRVRSEADLPIAHCYVFDTTPRTLVDVLGHRIPPRARDALDAFEYGDAAAKVDFVLDGPVPWTVPDVGAGRHRARRRHARRDGPRGERGRARRARGPADDAGQRPDRRRRHARGARADDRCGPTRTCRPGPTWT